MIIIGGPVTNLLVSKINENLPAKFSDGKPWGIKGKLDIYSDDTVGLITKIPHPLNKDKTIIYIAGVRYIGTKAAVIAITRHWKQVLSRFTGQKEFFSIVQGFDLDGDGKIDSIEIIE